MHVSLCHYCLYFSDPAQLDGELLLAPGFASPPNVDYVGYHSYIDENLPPESPYLYGLHPNAEIGFLTTTSESLFRTVLEMQPRDTSGAGASGTTREEKVSHLKYYITNYIYSLVAMNKPARDKNGKITIKMVYNTKGKRVVLGFM